VKDQPQGQWLFDVGALRNSSLALGSLLPAW